MRSCKLILPALKAAVYESTLWCLRAHEEIAVWSDSNYGWFSSDFHIFIATGDPTFGAVPSGYSPEEMVPPWEYEQTKPDASLSEKHLSLIPGGLHEPWQQDYAPLEGRDDAPFSEYLIPSHQKLTDLHWQAVSNPRHQGYFNTSYCAATNYEPVNSQLDQSSLEPGGLEPFRFWNTQEKQLLPNPQAHHRSAAARHVQSRRSFHRPKPMLHPKMKKLASLPASFHIPPHPWEQEETHLWVLNWISWTERERCIDFVLKQRDKPLNAAIFVEHFLRNTKFCIQVV